MTIRVMCDNCKVIDEWEWAYEQQPFFSNGLFLSFRNDEGSEDCELEICCACKERLLDAFPSLKAVLESKKEKPIVRKGTAGGAGGGSSFDHTLGKAVGVPLNHNYELGAGGKGDPTYKLGGGGKGGGSSDPDMETESKGGTGLPPDS